MNWNPLFSGPYIRSTIDDRTIILYTEPGPGCVFSVLFFWALPCFLSEMRADRFKFAVTDTGTIECEIRCKRALMEYDIRILHDVSETKIVNGRRSNNGRRDDEEGVLPYSPCVFIIVYSGGQYRALEGTGHFEYAVEELSEAVNRMINANRRAPPVEAQSGPSVDNDTFTNAVAILVQPPSTTHNLIFNPQFPGVAYIEPIEDKGDEDYCI